VTLSGGQKQRIALARAIFANPDVSLLDDCFSALDSTTGGLVFRNLFSVSADHTGILRNSGTMLVTHAIHFLPEVDYIIALSAGSPKFCGTWSEFSALGNDTSNDLVNDIKISPSSKKKKPVAGNLHKEGLSVMEGIIMTVEQRRYGRSTLSTWIEWFSNAGGWPFVVLQVVFLVLDRGLYIISDWWLAAWSNATVDGFTFLGIYFPPQIEGRAAQVKYVTVYACIILLSVIAGILRSQWSRKFIVENPVPV